MRRYLYSFGEMNAALSFAIWLSPEACPLPISASRARRNEPNTEWCSRRRFREKVRRICSRAWSGTGSERVLAKDQFPSIWRASYLISQHPGVSEVAVVGIKDEKWGERPMALVVPKEDHIASLREEDSRIHLRGFSEKGMLSKYAVPETVKFIETIDKTSVGKCDKKQLRKKCG